MNKGTNYLTQMADLEKLSPKFGITSATYYISTQVQVVQGCYGWLAINYGNIIATIEQIPLLPRLSSGLIGQAFGFMDNERLYAKKALELNITDGGSDPMVVLIQIFLQ